MNFVILSLVCALISTLFIKVETARILGIFPHYGYSHFKVFLPLLHALSDRGHNLTVITHIKSPILPKGHYEELLLEGMESTNVVSLEGMGPRTWKSLLDEYFEVHHKGQASCKRLYESGYVEEILKRHKQEPYDLVITEYFNSDCQLALPYIMNTPVVGLSSCVLFPWHFDRILMPDTPSFVQSELVGFHTPLNWHERLLNFLQSKGLTLLYRYHTNYLDNKLIKNYLNIDVDVHELAKQYTRLIMGNQHYSLMGLTPFTQQFVEIGGIHITDDDLNRDLPSIVHSFLENVQNPVIFISWGSMLKASSLDPKKLQSILEVLHKLDVKVIWKWEADKVPTESDQFLFIKWVPQLSLVCHPKISLFWGHGGLLSTTEALYCGKPTLLTPIYGDQFVNAYAVENRGIGRIIHLNDINELTLEKQIKEVLHSNYKTKTLEISKVFRDRPKKPIDTAIWWVEHILQHNVTTEVLHSYAVDLNWFVFYSVDAVLIILATLISFFFLFKALLRLIFDRCSPVENAKVKLN